MNTRISKKEFESYLSSTPESNRCLLTGLREILLKNFPDFNEAFKWGNPVYSTNNNLCYIAVSRNHVKLGFFVHGPKLDDPDELIEGTGKKMRHYKIRSKDDLNEKRMVDWIQQIVELEK
tara:strand:+ start:22097 stop:22456 length:360 start_codon:yes stop_codon:yes gene_type:complete